MQDCQPQTKSNYNIASTTMTKRLLSTVLYLYLANYNALLPAIITLQLGLQPLLKSYQSLHKS